MINITSTLKEAQTTRQINKVEAKATEDKTVSEGVLRQWQEKVTYDYEHLDKEIYTMHRTLEELQKNLVTFDDLNTLIVDIKESFDTFVLNATPRATNDEMEKLNKRLQDVERKLDKMDSSLSDIPLNFQLVSNTTSEKVPKLNLKRKTKTT